MLINLIDFQTLRPLREAWNMKGICYNSKWFWNIPIDSITLKKLVWSMHVFSHTRYELELLQSWF